ncbi:MAG TPA: GNAT family N-acetyltransferase, partial [Burkholderiaceae bacterium]
MRIVEVQEQDTSELVQMWRASFEHGVGVTDPHPIEEQIDFLWHHLAPAHRLRVARRADRIVGFLASNPESIAALYVRVENIGQGIGSRLLQLAQSESSGSLWLFTFARNVRARQFYESRGFVAVEYGFESKWRLDDVKYRWLVSRLTAKCGPSGPDGSADSI